MKRENFGVQIFDEKGQLILEIGPHVIRQAPRFAEMIGIVAASWSQLEVHLNCLFATLLNTTPDDAANELKKYRTAATATNGARTIASRSLSGDELESVVSLLALVDELRGRRNRIQHDVWAKKDNGDHRLFAVHASQYLAFTTRLFAIQESKGTDFERSARAVKLADEFSASELICYSVGDFAELADEIDRVSKELMKAMFRRISQRLPRD